MGLLSKAKEWISETDMDDLEEEYVEEEEEVVVKEAPAPKKRQQKVVAQNTRTVSNDRPLPTSKDCAIALFNPKSYQEATKIGTVLKNRKAAIVNVSELPMEQSKRITDFLQGIVFAIEGNFYKVGDKIILYVPKNIDVDNTEASNSQEEE